MKLAIFALVTIGCLIAVVRSAEEEYDYEEESAAPITPAPARSNSARLGGLLSPRGRTSVGRKTPSATTVQSTTAKAVEQSVEVEDEGDENLDENQDQQEDSPTTTTTESPKKVRGGVRPFRSNQDLLAALKRRRAQAGSNGQRESAASQTVTETTTPKSKGTTHSRSKGNGASENASKSSGRGRFGGTRGSKPLQEEVEETQREEVQVKPKPYRRG